MAETRFAMVSEWMVNRDMNNFLKENPDVNRLKLVRSPLITLLHRLYRFLNNFCSWWVSRGG